MFGDMQPRRGEPPEPPIKQLKLLEESECVQILLIMKEATSIEIPP
jgi:hypothetical protein